MAAAGLPAPAAVIAASCSLPSSSSAPAPSRSDRSSLAGMGAIVAINPSAASNPSANNNPSAASNFAGLQQPPAGFPSSPDGSFPDVDTSQGPNPTLHGSDVPRPSANPNANVRSYAAVTSNAVPRPPPKFVTNLTAFHPVKRGNAVVLKMPDELYRRRLSAFRYALIGRIFLPKHAPPRALPDLKSELQILFKSVHDWSLTPLGKGFYSLKFADQGDQRQASRFTSWRLKLGNFHIREWKPNFDPYKEQTSITQIWVRLFHLPEEYWDPEFLVGIFRAVGNVVKLDGSTAAGMVGHFARALIEVDLSYPLAESVTIECGSHNFVVEFGFENTPLFCSYCRYIGHAVADCKSRKKAEEIANNGANAESVVPKPNAKQAWKAKTTSPAGEQVTTSNSYAALNNSDLLEAPNADHVPVREMAPLSAEATAALKAIQGRDFTKDWHLSEDSDDDTVAEDVQMPEMASVGNPVEAPAGAAGMAAEVEIAQVEMVADVEVGQADGVAEVDDEHAVVAAEMEIGHTEVAAEVGIDGAEVVGEVVSVTANSSPSPFKKLPFSNDGVTALAKRIARLSEQPSLHTRGGGAKQVEERLKQAYQTGAAPSAYSIDPGDSDTLKAMRSVATQRWSSVIDEATAAGRLPDDSQLRQ